MPIIFDRSRCRDLSETISREWLVTNSLGGYASGTVAGVLTRRQHGLLVTASPGSVQPQLLLAKIDEEVAFDQRTYYLGTNEYHDGTLNPSGFVHLETFRLEEGFPVFLYHLGGINGIILEKRIWLLQTQNTTCIQYRVLHRRAEDEASAQHALSLTLLPLTTCRPYNQLRRGGDNQHFQVQVHRTNGSIDANGWRQPFPKGVAGCTIQESEYTYPYHLLAVTQPENQATIIPTGVWFRNFQHRLDVTADCSATDDLYLPVVIRTTLSLGTDQTLTIIASTEGIDSLVQHPDQLKLSFKRSIEHQEHIFYSALQPQRYFGEGGEAAQAHHLRILPLTTTPDPQAGGEDYLRLLLLSGERFIMHFASSRQENIGKFSSLFGGPERTAALRSNYYDLEYRIRDALIALPGLLLVPERYDTALLLLRTIARHFRGGLLPDHFALPGQPQPNVSESSADTTLWFFYALDQYVLMTHHYELVEELYNHLIEAINSHVHGTPNGVRVDPQDGLLYAHCSGKALTWMNATVRGIPVTPRIGKPIEVNALWYHALFLMHKWSQHLNSRYQFTHFASSHQALLEQCYKNFQKRFWYPDGGYLYDVLDGPEGNDTSLRPNQILALSLGHSSLDTEIRQRVFDVVTQHLLTPYGLRTLAPYDTAYHGSQGTHKDDQQHALHQGSTWPWLLGPYIDAMLTLRNQPVDTRSCHEQNLYYEYLWRKGLQLLEPFKDRLYEDLLGMCPALFDGDAPYKAGLAAGSASVLSVSELLRVYDLLARMRISQPEHMLSR